MDQFETSPATLGSVTTQSFGIFQKHAGPLLLLCAAGVGFDAILTYGGGLITLGYGEPVFAVLSVVLQEVLYFGPAVLVWNEILRARDPDRAPEPPVVSTLLSGFRSGRAWGIASGVTLVYMVGFSLLACVGTVLGGFLLLFVPGAFTIAIKLLRTVIGPIMGVGYLATAVAVARPNRGVTQSIMTAAKLMITRPLLAGLVLGVGGFLEQAAGMTVVLGILLDAFLLCYSAAVVRTLMDAGELQE